MGLAAKVAEDDDGRREGSRSERYPPYEFYASRDHRQLPPAQMSRHRRPRHLVSLSSSILKYEVEGEQRGNIPGA